MEYILNRRGQGITGFLHCYLNLFQETHAQYTEVSLGRYTSTQERQNIQQY